MLPVMVVAAGRPVSQATPAMTPTLVLDTTVTQGSRLSCLNIVDVVDMIDNSVDTPGCGGRAEQGGGQHQAAAHQQPAQQPRPGRGRQRDREQNTGQGDILILWLSVSLLLFLSIATHRQWTELRNFE